MKKLSKLKSLLYGTGTILIGNLIVRDDWEPVLIAAGIFLIGGFIVKPLMNFMTNNKKNEYY